MMDKKTIQVVIACLVALIAWQTLVNRIYPPKPKPIAARPPAPTAVSTVTVQQAEAVKPTEKPAELLKEATAEPEEPRAAEQIVTLSNDCVRMEFTSGGGGVRSVELLKHKTNGSGNVVLNGKDFAPALALTGVTNAGSDAAFALAQPAPDTVVMKCHTRTGLDITKTFKLGNGYLLDGIVEIARSPQAVALTNALELVIGTATPANAKELPSFLTASWLAGEKYQYRDLGQIAKNAGKGVSNEMVNARWGAVKSQFFTMLLTPSTNASEVAYKQVELARPADWKAKQPPQGVSAALKLVPTATTNDLSERYEFTWYAGPTEYERLVALHGGQEEVMQLGFWGVISVGLLKSMKFFYRLIPNYGIAIIIITILIKILFWPVQAKSIKSMKAMQKFQPLIGKLREKYKDDPQRLNAETMKLYKEHKINPFAGCLPMVVQIPVFFALFAMLRSAVELRGAAFLWIKDLSQPDTVAHVLGFPLNPLPIAMGVSMIWQMKLTPSGGDPKQQQMMMFMPLMMLYFFYSSSSGLVLYWTVQQFLSIAQQWWSMRQADPMAPAVPMTSTGKAK